jgi:exodeoxyribonuclease VII large subunit
VTAQVVPVSLLSSYIRQLFDSDPVLGDIWVEGEVSNLFTSRSGHVYFTLGDGESQIKCVLFRSFALRQRLLPSPGDQLAAHGRVSIYERDGTYQLYADVVEHAGQGLMALQFERLRQKLEADGLFDNARKRPLPVLPRYIGVVTSAEGAVWHDIQIVLRRRYPLAHLILSPAPVQGVHAPDGIVAAIERIQVDGRAELVIVARGGGSAEDLACFNDERVARAVFACRVPVISAVGHETDWTILDLVADLRAPTPSAAAELCAPSIDSLMEMITDSTDLLRAAVDGYMQGAGDAIAGERAHVERFSPKTRLNDARAELGRLGTGLGIVQTATLPTLHARLGSTQDAFRLCGQTPLTDRRSQLSRLQAVIEVLDPATVLRRGYAILERPDNGAVVTSVNQLDRGAPVNARLYDGVLTAIVDYIDAVHGVGHNARA